MSTQERIKQFADDLTEPVRGYAATPYRWTAPHMIPARDWLYGNLLARKFVTATVGPGGTMKTSKAITEALAMVTGRPLLGVTPRRQLAVWVLNLEDPIDEMRRRVQAAAQHYGIGVEDLGDRFFVDSGRDRPLVIGRPSGRGVDIDRAVVDPFVAEIKRRKIDVVIIDPFVSSHRVPENDNGAIDAIVKEFGVIAEKGNCAVELIHHTRKGSDGEVSAENARGGRSFVDACRSVRVVTGMTTDEAKKAGIENPRSFFRIVADKANMTPPGQTAGWMQVVSVGLGNGGKSQPEDSIGVAAAWRWPDHTDGVGDDQRAAAVAAVRSGVWRESSQATEWVGTAIARALGLNLSEKAELAKVKALLRMWIGDGTFLIVEKPDPKRMMRKFVEASADA